ncbi:SdpI family protein [Hymenobacter sp. BT186]|uniref:SdpI family protein n=1 Tax=Hymenobacter telluris TaxID=2816474 RepID=A0A939JCW3_9BACT|nr:SdpI family protein [Hymenobacter telluris]MBO0357717.1 SdpI family protein [Hymenobacter telluris]MBW3373744.1 SdpI family protein [Hymenobacter norwichensis]
MKTKFSIWHLLTLLALVLPTIYLATTWDALPTQIPTHFDSAGNANGYTDKQHIWLLCLGLPVGTYLLLNFLPRFDPKQRLEAGNTNYQKLILALVALMSGLSMYSLYAALHPGGHTGKGLAVIMGVFFAFMGNYLTTVQPNYFVGFKTPWALEFPRIWARVHRVGGWLFFATGLLSAAVALLWSGEVATGVLIVGVLGTVGVVYSYSYWLYRKEMQTTNAG